MSKKKKGAEEEQRILFGKPKNTVKIGLVGLPNVGKSSTFNLLGKLQVPAENFPFCTIEPAKTTVVVPDPRFDFLVDNWKPKKEIPAVLTITDIAGLVEGASEGQGMGNEFLANIEAVDAIYHVVRKFPGKKIEHVMGDVDPTRDLRVIRGELQAKDLTKVKSRLEAEQKKLRGRKATKEQEMEFKALQKCIDLLEAKKDVRFGEWDPKEIFFLNTLNLLSAKPVVYLVNLGKKAYTEGKGAGKKIAKWVEENCPGDKVVHYSAKFEAAYAKLEEKKKQKLKEKIGVGSALPNVIWAGYKALNLVHFFTTGKDEVRAWSIRRFTKAPQAAGTIHGDFEKHFISADVYKYDDFKALGTEAAVKAAGKLMTKGKSYTVVDGDIMLVHHNAGGAGKKKK